MVTGIWSYDDPNSFPPGLNTEADTLNRKDTRSHPVRTPWSLYKNARPYSATQNVAWQKTSDYSGNQYNSLTKASTYVMIKYYNQDDETDASIPVGYMTFSWYIVFRG